MDIDILGVKVTLLNGHGKPWDGRINRPYFRPAAMLPCPGRGELCFCRERGDLMTCGCGAVVTECEYVTHWGCASCLDVSFGDYLADQDMEGNYDSGATERSPNGMAGDC